MIPYLLAAVGGYLIGQSQKKDVPQMADGGLTDDENKRLSELQKKKDDLRKEQLDRMILGVKGGKKDWEKRIAIVNTEINELLKKKYGRKMADGGVLEHGLREDDKIYVERGNLAGIKNMKTEEKFIVDISTGSREKVKD